MAKKIALDDLVQSVKLYNRRPLFLHIYLGPFIILYPIWFYIWGWFYGFSEHTELGTIGTGGLIVLQVLAFLFCHWFVSIGCFFTCSKAKDPYKASLALVVPTKNNGWPEVVPLQRSKREDGHVRLWFEFQKVHYIYDAEEKKQFKTVEFPINLPMKHYQEWKGYDTEESLQNAIYVYGDNKMEMAVPQFMELFLERATAPFFVFQVFCVGLWCLDEMWYYSVFTLMMLVTFEATLVKQQLRNMAEIRNMGNKPYTLQVYRNRRWRPALTNSLVAGDIVSICRSPNENAIPCDLLLLRGPCIVDESMLTGESVPQLKEPIEELDKDCVFDMDNDGRLHVLFGGTKVVQHTSPAKNEPGLKAPDNGCICYVLRSSFHTSQGRLLRTILFGVKRVTANNLETFCFILFLLIFAIAAAAYVWIKGTEDENRNKYKLFLECTLILTSVVPPELPIELSLAVNTSLLALQKLGVYCTEPFRIPFGGKVDICCFDKTGTLTTDNLVVEGLAGINGGTNTQPISEAPLESLHVLAGCHSLVKLDEDLVGDPLEKACLTSVEWALTKNDIVIPKKGKHLPLKIFHRFNFSSALKRMSVIAGYNPIGSSETEHVSLVKGAPETLKSMFVDPPANYDDTYQKLTRQGARVLALGYRTLGRLSYQQIRETKRDDIERKLYFVGFVVISCPLKTDSKNVIREIIDSSHKVVMITGDNPLTACHVSHVLKFTKRKHTLILERWLTDNDNDDNEWRWVSIDRSVNLPEIPEKADWSNFVKEYDLCLTGASFARLLNDNQPFIRFILPYVQVYARMAPKQKEKIITELKSLGHVTLMCGDGTNDVGALKHADVGVALLSHPAPKEKHEELLEAATAAAEQRKNTQKQEKINNGPISAGRRRPGPPSRRPEAPSRATAVAKPKTAAEKKMEQMMRDLEEEERAQVVRLGDASIAAPFTSKYTSIQSICHVIKQGRCTLVTTLQMFKILALNALVLAYSQSVLYLDGIKFSDTQATVQGLLLAACFLFISRSKPLNTLSRQRPMVNILNIYTLGTVTLQFAVHFFCLLYLVQQAHARSPPREDRFVNLDQEFKPSLLNTTVYIMSVALQVSTFAVNYRGRPFMESLLENKAMLYSLMFSGGWILALAAGLLPEMSEKFELVKLEEEFRNVVLLVLLLDLAACYVIDRVFNFIFGDIRIKKIS